MTLLDNGNNCKTCDDYNYCNKLLKLESAVHVEEH